MRSTALIVILFPVGRPTGAESLSLSLSCQVVSCLTMFMLLPTLVLARPLATSRPQTIVLPGFVVRRQRHTKQHQPVLHPRPHCSPPLVRQSSSHPKLPLEAGQLQDSLANDRPDEWTHFGGRNSVAASCCTVWPTLVAPSSNCPRLPNGIENVEISNVPQQQSRFVALQLTGQLICGA